MVSFKYPIFLDTLSQFDQFWLTTPPRWRGLFAITWSRFFASRPTLCFAVGTATHALASTWPPLTALAGSVSTTKNPTNSKKAKYWHYLALAC
ncbi:MAG TPA: hypothetical protein VLL52_02345 [Anaerolineae bacterium]|nr:hypothetical protein [Anaerolineae bacterium]